LSPAALDYALGKLTPQRDPNLLIGFDKADDAGVYQIAPDRALVQTVDFFTPMVDDPFIFGQIAAVNALSDVYAMGGSPLTALTLVCFPEKGDLDVLGAVLEGGLSKMNEAGCTIAGGHSVRDPEIKFGYSVTGMVDPRRVLANSTAQPSDSLVFTKALGTGVISTAIKRNAARQEWIDAAVQSMTTLNRISAEIMTRPEFSVHACTDITGFGLIGHLREMAQGAGVEITLEAQAVQALPGARDCIEGGFIPGGLKANQDFAECAAEFAEGVEPWLRTLLFDPQTAGGLLISVASEQAEPLVRALRDAGVSRAAVIGKVSPRSPERRPIQVI
jgi:selenide, water dikinase